MRSNPRRPTCWAVWTLGTNGLTSLRVLATTQGFAAKARKSYANQDDVVRAWVNELKMDHLYGEGLLELKVHRKAVVRK